MKGHEIHESKRWRRFLRSFYTTRIARTILPYPSKLRWLVLSVLLSTVMLLRSVWMTSPSHQHMHMNIEPIPRIQVSDDLSYEEFFRLTEHKPIIIEGAARDHPAFDMDFADLKDLCGHATIHSAVYSSTAMYSFGVVHPQPESLAQYLDDMFLHKEIGANNTRYASFMHLPQLCPILERLIKVNKYVAFDVQQGGIGTDEADIQPEMFAGPAGTKSEIHIDDPYYPFWMNVYKGSKRFRTIDFDEALSAFGRKVLAQDTFSRMVGSFWHRKPVKLEIWNPDLDVFPELSKLTVYEGSVNAGDFIYLPPAMLHGVLNDEDSFGLSVNSLPIPHAHLHFNVVSKLNRNREDFYFHAACDKKYMTQQDPQSCMDHSPIVRRLRARIEFHKNRLQDRPLYALNAFESSDEYCAYQMYYGSPKFNGQQIEWGTEYAWQHMRHRLGKWNKMKGCDVEKHSKTLSRLLHGDAKQKTTN